MKKNWPFHAIYLGFFLLLLGTQMFAVDSYTLTPGATQFLSRWTGPSTETAEGKLQSFIVNNTTTRGTIHLPDWIVWGTFCAGAVLTVHGISQLKRGRG